MRIDLKKAGQGLYLIFTLVPLLAGGIYALGYSLGLFGILSEGFTLSHWKILFSDGRFISSLWFSLQTAVITIALSTAIALWLTLRYKKIWDRPAWEWTLYVPLSFPAIVAAFITFQLLGSSGLFSRLSYHLGWTDGIRDFPVLIHDAYGIGIIGMHTLMATPFFTLFFRSVWKKERIDQLSEIAIQLGATASQVSRRVVLPILLKRIRPLLLLYGIFVANAYEAPLLLGSQHPQMMTLFIVNKIQRFDLTERPQAYAALCVVIVLTALLLVTGLGGWIKRRQAW